MLGEAGELSRKFLKERKSFKSLNGSYSAIYGNSLGFGCVLRDWKGLVVLALFLVLIFFKENYLLFGGVCFWLGKLGFVRVTVKPIAMKPSFY
ncbi:hypothetical protein PIB30_087681 [Stylosanthes scabra]|uniref:Transmembrane protein n=1 Tax=Stylosanthes scabra TaxID=79078 RepID=A0ABU6RTX6_9FABA|nr:hypothetical protein [Stylosanthes scabra]